jgi:hypothetical protein
MTRPHHVDSRGLTPKEINILNEFHVALRQARELEVEKLRHALYILEFLRDEMAVLLADTRAGRLQ